MSNGQIVSVMKVVDNGPSATRWDLVILGDGYTAEKLFFYESQVDELIHWILNAEPFRELQSAINVHRVNVASDDSGVSDLCKGVLRSTFFESTFCGPNRIDRSLTTNQRRALEVAEEAVAEMNGALMIVNSEKYGGSGEDAVAVVSTGALDQALHEMGHSFFHLADEYPFYSSCAETDHDRYAGAEPAEPNVTADRRATKWSKLLTRGVDLPTTRNANCSQCDPQPSPLPSGTIGAFEGARYFKCGLYRPSFDCVMGLTGRTFCAVCQDAIRRTLTPFRRKKRRSVRS